MNQFKTWQCVKNLLCRVKALENAPPPTIPDQKLCNITTPYTSPRSGWWQGWTPVYTANVPRFIVTPWRTAGTRTNNYCEPVDLRASIIYGNHLIYSRRIRSYLWLEWRVLVNNTTVFQATYDKYSYKDKRQDTNPDIITPFLYEIEPKSTSQYTRLNIPIGAVVEVQTQARLQAVGAQSNAYMRYIGGLRSHASIDFHPKNIVVGRL